MKLKDFLKVVKASQLIEVFNGKTGECYSGCASGLTAAGIDVDVENTEVTFLESYYLFGEPIIRIEC